MSKLKAELLAQMKEQGISKAELARRLNICRQGVNGFFNRKQTTDLATITRYAEAVGCKLEFKIERAPLS